MNNLIEIDQEEKPRIAVIDHGMGNWRSAQSGLEFVGADAPRTKDREEILSADGLVLPGVGAYPEAMRRIKQRDLIEPIKRFNALGKPILGICLGHQLLFEASDEHEYTKGLGLLEGAVKSVSPQGSLNLGWREVAYTREDKLIDSIAYNSMFYHLHTHVAVPEDSSIILCGSRYQTPKDYGIIVSGIQKDNLYGVQFHPESSGKHPGLTLLKNFVDICSEDS